MGGRERQRSQPQKCTQLGKKRCFHNSAREISRYGSPYSSGFVPLSSARWDMSWLQQKPAWLGGSCPQQNQAGSKRRTDPRTHTPVHSCVCTWWPPKPLCGKADLQSCNVPRPPVHQWDQFAPLAVPTAHSKAGGTEGGCNENRLGVPKQLLPCCLTRTSISSLHLMVRTRSWLHGWHPSKTSDSPSLLPGQVPSLCPSPGSNTMLLKL